MKKEKNTKKTEAKRQNLNKILSQRILEAEKQAAADKKSPLEALKPAEMRDVG